MDRECREGAPLPLTPRVSKALKIDVFDEGGGIQHRIRACFRFLGLSRVRANCFWTR